MRRAEIIKKVESGVPLRKLLGHKGNYRGKRKREQKREYEKHLQAKKNYDEFMERMKVIGR